MEKKLSDYEVEYHEGVHAVGIRTKDDGCTGVMGQIEWAKRRILALVASIPIYDIITVSQKGDLRVELDDGNHLVITEDLVDDMYQEYKEAQVDELEYVDDMDELWDEIKDRMTDGIRERLDNPKVDVDDIKIWMVKWKTMLETMNDLINREA